MSEEQVTEQATEQVAEAQPVELVDVTVQVPKPVKDFSDALSALILKIKEAGADGWQVATDVPAVVLEALKDLPLAMAALKGVPQALGEQKLKSAMAVLDALDKVL